MNTYQVTAKRWAHGWELHIADIGVTQTRSLARAERDVNDYLDLLIGDEDRNVIVTPELEPVVERNVRDARSAIDELAQLQRTAARKSRDAVALLGEHGYSGAEIAVVLNVSPQRVSQLVASSSGSGKTTTAALQASAVATKANRPAKGAARARTTKKPRTCAKP